MAIGKRKETVECDCGLDIAGFSEKHAKQNLRIHKNISKKHKELLDMKKKWLKMKKEN